MKNNSKLNGPAQPLIFAVVLAVGLLIGRGCDNVPTQNTSFSSRISEILNQIEHLYVDSVNREKLVDAAVQAIVGELDPHTYYFSQKELEDMAEPMDGNFEGIGVEFIIQDDTLMVVNAILGGPSESAGIRSGDRIISVEGEEISGANLDNNRVQELLKGARGTKVGLGLMRSKSNERYEVIIEREKIPIHSVVASFVIDENVGYVKVIRFAANTAEEFLKALQELKKSGAKSVIVDLRSNGGGYLQSAIDMIDRFLDEGLDILYTEGKSSPRRDYKSSFPGKYADWPIAILIDENSASASEIFAGAIQDNDRGLIVGRRSFGKGLVQEEFAVRDAGALRLTVARFYTPSGRAIQKPYGEGVDYAHDHEDRLLSGELFNKDSIHNIDTVVYRTVLGREVFAGGGITPDIFVPLDSANASRALSELIWTGGLRDAAFTWVDKHRVELDVFNNLDELEASDLWKDRDEGGIATIRQTALNQGTVWPVGDSEEVERIERRFFAQVTRILYGEQEYYRVLTDGDTFIDRAIYELLEAGRFGLQEGRLYLLSTKVDTSHSELINLTDHGF